MDRVRTDRVDTMRRGMTLGAGLALAVFSSAGAATHGGGATKDAIKKVLDDSAVAWSRGDLNAFMTCYENGPLTSYVTGAGAGHDVVSGYTAIRDMYAARFGGAPGAMGKLSMDLFEVRPLGEAHALVTGRYHLARAGQADASGVFTLVFHKSAAGWRIVSDHTS